MSLLPPTMWVLAPLILACVAPQSLDAFNITQSTCSRCARDRAIFKKMTKASIKEEILRKLNFDTAPSFDTSIANSHMVRSLIKKLEQETDEGMLSDQPGPGYSLSLDQDDYHFRPSSVIIPASQAPVRVRAFTPLYFKLSDRVIDSKKDLFNAVLNVHLPAARNSQDPRPQARISVYYVAVDKKTGAGSLVKAKENKVDLRRDAGGWVPLHLLTLARIWLNHPDENLGLVVRVHSLSPDKAELDIGAANTEQAPYMQLDIRDSAWRSRTKRTTNRVCSEEYDPGTTECCMWPLTINFDEFGWDWVLFPRTYEANICSGSCELGTPAEHPHGSLTQMAGLHSTAGPCCSPKKMAPINMLYLDQDYNVILGKLPSMKVQRCGCK